MSLDRLMENIDPPWTQFGSDISEHHPGCVGTQETTSIVLHTIFDWKYDNKTCDHVNMHLHPSYMHACMQTLSQVYFAA